MLSSSARLPCNGSNSGTPMGTPSTPKTPAFPIPSTPKTPAFPIPSTPKTPAFPIPSTPKAHQMTPKGTPSTVSKKRPIQDEEGTPKPKKPRAKPQIQENLDVELFARANQLQKANAATLTAWLKDKGIQYKSKDKKSDLIDRVNTVLGLAMEP